MNDDHSLMEELRRIYLFEALDDKQMARVMQSMVRVRLDVGEQLFEFGQVAERFYLVHSGRIKLYRLSPEGREKVIEVISPGGTFAEAIMFMKQHSYPVSSEAMEPTELYSFDMKGFSDLLHESPPTCFRLLAGMSRRLRGLVNEIDNITLQNATHRVVEYLLSQLPAGVIESSSIHLTIPKSVIASQLSIQSETFSRILARLHNKALISVQGSTITLHDLEGLRRLL